MKTLLVMLAVVVAAGGCPRTLSETDRAALQDFRTVERACLARAEEIRRDDSIHLSEVGDLVKSINEELVKPWQAMRARVKLEERKLGDDLSKVLGRYFDERELAWTSLAKAIAQERYGAEVMKNHRWQYRESDEAATKDQAIIEAKLGALKLPPLPPIEVPPRIELDPPPPSTTPGAAFFFTKRSVVRLDNSGFRTIATDVDMMDVLPDGTMWACSLWHLVHWDGAKATEYKPKLPANLCAAAPGGAVWVLNDRHYEQAVDQLGWFDGKTWKITNAAIGAPGDSTDGLLADRDGRLYALNHVGYGGDGAFVLEKSWKKLALQGASQSSYIDHLHRGEDGAIWATYQMDTGGKYPAGFARLQPSGGDAPAWVADDHQQEKIYPFVDAAGVFTVLDPKRNVITQGKKELKLRLPVPFRGWGRDNRGPFAFDGASRMWLDLADGINVIEKNGTYTVYPRGSIEGLVQNIETIVVTGAGPTLVPPGPVIHRTISGKLREGGKLELAMCADAWARECLPGLPRWTTTSDAEGNFTFEKVPRWRMSIQGLVGLSGQKMWRVLNAECCADNADLGEMSFHREAQY